jgi:hypothetical protein
MQYRHLAAGAAVLVIDRSGSPFCYTSIDHRSLLAGKPTEGLRA